MFSLHFFKSAISRKSDLILKLNRLKHQNENLKTQAEEFRLTHMRLENEIREVRKERDAIKSRLRELGKELESNKLVIDQLNRKITELRTENETLIRQNGQGTL